jgi:predicted phosphodiesterase
VRAAILTDIHGNLPALQKVLAAIADAGPDEVWCLGDVVGYGAQPDQCAELVRERCDLCLIGNHDLAVIGKLEVDDFSPAAAEAVVWTQEHATGETLEFLRGLEPADTSRAAALYHASPRDPVWEYVLSLEQARDCLQIQDSRVSLIGHSHVALYFTCPDSDSEPPLEDVFGAQADSDRHLDLALDRWLINPGSVGQPRDGDPRAAWMELDTEPWSATFRRHEYDIAVAADAIRSAGLPAQLADRLRLGQ